MLSLPTPQDLRSKRMSLGLTQSKLAEDAGVSQSLIARIELGEVDPSYSTLRSIVETLNRIERRELTLGEVMNTEVVSVAPGDAIGEAVETMRERGFSQLPVLESGAPVGSVSERDIVHALNETEREDLAEDEVRKVMAAPFPAMDPDERVEVAIRMLEDRPALLVMEEGRVVGMLTKSDLLGTIEEGA